MKQQVFDLLKINREDTKNAVEQALEKYRIYLWSIAESDMPKITATYSIVPPTQSNAFSSKTEDAAIRNCELESERFKYMRNIECAVNRLRHNERQIITARYMTTDESFDYTIYRDLHLSERQFYRIKSRAFYKLAFSLKLEVYEK